VAKVEHAVYSLALRLEDASNSVFYSGDGRSTPESSALAGDCDLVIHEAFGLDPVKPDHGSVRESIEFAVRAGAAHLALVHVQRDVRAEKAGEIREMLAQISGMQAFLPRSGDSLKL
jgi:ribonuclease BN (tRNA processing enzyme)